MPEDPQPTFFLPAERAGAAEVAETAERVCQTQTVRTVLDAMPGPAVVINRFRQILAANRRLLDDLGLVPALEAYIHDFPATRGLRVEFTAFAGAELVDRNASGLALIWRWVCGGAKCYLVLDSAQQGFRVVAVSS